MYNNIIDNNHLMITIRIIIIIINNIINDKIHYR